VAERVGRGLPGEHSALLARARQLPAAVWFVILVVAALLVAVGVSIVFHNSNPIVSDNPKAFVVTYQVTKSTLSTSRCEIQAEDQYMTVVGTVYDVVGPTGKNQRTTVRTLTIPTTDQAVSASVISCHLLHTS
jgi:uncharacterized membrane protein YqiK